MTKPASIPIYRQLYAQVLVAVMVGALLGRLAPATALQLKPLGDVFIKLIRMMIEPIIFTTVVVGIAKMSSQHQVGRVGLKALVYFEVVTTFALVLGLVAANLLRPGAGISIDSVAPATDAIAAYTQSAQKLSVVEVLVRIVPDTVVGAFARGDTLAVLFFSVLFGLALSAVGAPCRPLVDTIDQISKGLFGVVGLIMRVAPIGVLGAMAFAIGRFGVGALHQLALLVLTVYAACIFFIFGVLGLIARLAGFRLWRFLRYIRDEIVLVFGTSTSESALPGLMAKLERMGCDKSVVGLVVPTGYAFNLDGTAIYLSMAVLFISQAGHVNLAWQDQLGILGVLLLTSKGSAAVTGAGFVTLAATLSAFPALPVGGLALLLGVDRFLSEARSLTNLIGNGVATVVIARWEGSLDRAQLDRALRDGP